MTCQQKASFWRRPFLCCLSSNKVL